jgi:hypothetical protein
MTGRYNDDNPKKFANNLMDWYSLKFRFDFTFTFTFKEGFDFLRFEVWFLRFENSLFGRSPSGSGFPLQVLAIQTSVWKTAGFPLQSLTQQKSFIKVFQAKLEKRFNLKTNSSTKK